MPTLKKICVPRIFGSGAMRARARRRAAPDERMESWVLLASFCTIVFRAPALRRTR